MSEPNFSLRQKVKIKKKFAEGQEDWFDSKALQGVAYVMGNTITISGVKIYGYTYVYSVFENSQEWLEDMLEEIKD